MVARLKQLRNSKCDLCALSKGASSVCVSGEGGDRLKVVILGEAPGKDEDKTGRPFVGPSGKLLRAELQKAGLPLSSCWITNTVKCFPHGTPSPNEVRICSDNYLRREIRTLEPDYILTLGRIALSAVLPGYSLSDIRGQLCSSWLGNAFVFPTWHPAYLLRNKSRLPQWRVDLSNFKTLVEVDGGSL